MACVDRANGAVDDSFAEVRDLGLSGAGQVNGGCAVAGQDVVDVASWSVARKAFIDHDDRLGELGERDGGAESGRTPPITATSYAGPGELVRSWLGIAPP